VRKLKLLTAVFLVTAILSGCSSTGNTLDRTVKFTSPDNAFKVTFPEKPSHRTETSYLDEAGYSMEVYESEGYTRYLSVSYGDRPSFFGSEKSVEDIAEEITNMFMKNKNIEIISQNKINTNGTDGMEYIMSTQGDAGRLIFRIYVTEKRVYYVIAEDKKDKIDSDIIKEFLESFTITEEP